MLSREAWRASGLGSALQVPQQPWQRSLEPEPSVGQRVPLPQLRVHPEHVEGMAPKPRDAPAAPQKQAKIICVLKSFNQTPCLHAQDNLRLFDADGLELRGIRAAASQEGSRFSLVGLCVPHMLPPSAGDLQGRRSARSCPRGLEALRSISCSSQASTEASMHGWGVRPLRGVSVCPQQFGVLSPAGGTQAPAAWHQLCSREAGEARSPQLWKDLCTEPLSSC